MLLMAVKVRGRNLYECLSSVTKLFIKYHRAFSNVSVFPPIRSIAVDENDPKHFSAPMFLKLENENFSLFNTYT